MRKFLILFLLISCFKSSLINRIKNNQIEVKNKKYPFQTHDIKSEDLKKIVNNLKKELAAQSDIFDLIVKKFWSYDGLNFGFRVAKLDNKRQRLILRYFSPLSERLFAGIIIEFVYNIKDKKFVEIYIYKIPVE